MKDYEKYEKMPNGWKILQGATTAPKGYVWIWNGKPRFGVNAGFKQALLKLKEEQ